MLQHTLFNGKISVMGNNMRKAQDVQSTAEFKFAPVLCDSDSHKAMHNLPRRTQFEN
jgi:hypothetical protein